MKVCSKCKQVKHLDEFYNNHKTNDGKGSWCKECCKIATRKYNKDNKELVKLNKLKYNKENYIRRWSSSTIRDHKRRGYNTKLSIDFIYELALHTKRCNFCGCELDWQHGTKYNDNTPTLERINNENDLKEDNICIICKKCNTTKSNRTMKEFVDYCRMIVKKYED